MSNEPPNPSPPAPDPAPDSHERLDAIDNIRFVLDKWVAGLAQVLEAMTDQSPEVHWKAISKPATELGISLDMSDESETLWWEQPFRISPEMLVWVAAPRTTWEYAGTATLNAAGLETVERNEARNTWIEILSQSLATLGSSIGAVLGQEAVCEPGAERPPTADPGEWASVQLSFRNIALAPLWVTLSPQLAAALAQPPKPNERRDVETEPVAAPAPEPQASPLTSRTLDLLMDVDLPVSVSFGKAKLLLKDVVKLTTGSIVELDRTVNEHVDVLVNHRLVARGEVVVVEGNYGVRILEIATPQDRLRSLQ